MPRIRILFPLQLFLLGVLVLSWSGCGGGGVEIIPETEEKQYQRGKLRLSQGRYEEALGAFLSVIDRRKAAPESHFEAAEIYLNHLEDPVTAIYHYRRYLEFMPESPEATVVRQRIETAQKDFARQLPAQPFQGALDRLDLMELLDSVRQENTQLKRQLLAARERVEALEARLGVAPSNAGASNPSASLDAPLRPPSTPGGADGTRPGDNRPADDTYTVVAGDTLTRISEKVYGNPGRWMDIYQANRDIMDGPNSLKVGQVLRLP